ncbi:MAG TPA: glycosyltransferase [Actinomycetota bacterium]
MTEAPPDVVAKGRARAEARQAKDFARADALRDEIAAAGYRVVDTATGFDLERLARWAPVDPSTIDDALAELPTCPLSFHVLYEGFPGDLERFLSAIGRHAPGAEAVVVDNASADGDAVQDVVDAFAFARAVHLHRPLGWARAHNAGLKTSRGAVVVLADLSIEPHGDVVGPLLEVFTDPAVGIAGPFGLVSEDMRSWREDPGPDVLAIEGYAMAVRREVLGHGLIHERFQWYRNADIDLSFQVRALGYRARVVPLPVARHAHRGWTETPEHDRERLSKRNHYTFFDRWKDRTDLLEP